MVLVLCKWNTLLIVLEALGLSRHCRQKCDICATSDERLHSSSRKSPWVARHMSSRIVGLAEDGKVWRYIAISIQFTLKYIVTFNSRLRVTQGHWKWNCSIYIKYKFLLTFHSYYGRILYPFHDEARYWSKITNFFMPCLHLMLLIRGILLKFRYNILCVIHGCDDIQPPARQHTIV